MRMEVFGGDPGSIDWDAPVGSYLRKVEVTASEIEDVMVGALESACQWAMLVKGEGWEEKPSDKPSSEWATELILRGKSVFLKDMEQESELYEEKERTEIFELTLDKVLRGLQMNSEKHPKDADLDMADDYTYDRIIQYGLFGKIVYS